MKRFVFLCGLVMFFCLVMVGVACYITQAAWYVWLLTIASNLAAMDLNISANKYPAKSSAQDKHHWCALVSWNCAGVLGLSCVLLGAMDGSFGSFVVIALCLSLIWLCVTHLVADFKDKTMWWLGWIITITFVMGGAVCKLMSNLGYLIPEHITYCCGLVTLIMLLITLIAGVKYYIWPPAKEIYLDIRDIRRAIKHYEEAE